MKSPRKEPWVNVRFKNLQETDDLELFANQRGFTLQNWMRMLAYREFNQGMANRQYLKDTTENSFFIRHLLEKSYDETSVKVARIRSEKAVEILDIYQEY